MMDMYSRNQYLKELRRDYLKSKNRKEKSKLLCEAEKRTNLNRKTLVRKLKPKSNLDKRKEERIKRESYYDSYVKVALVKVWKIFDYPCGQRLESSLREEGMIDRLRLQGELVCSNEVAQKLKTICARTIDKKLKHQKEVLRRFQEKGQPKSKSLLLKKIPIKVHGELDDQKLGNVEIDFVEHCGSSTAGEYVYTLDTVDIASGWQEWEAIMGRGQMPTKQGLNRARGRYPFPWLEIHPDNDTSFINNHLYQYTQETNLFFSRSRPYRKNDNCHIEQRNWCSVRKKFGYFRFDIQKELDILNDLYRNEIRLYRNFFQPIMRLKEKIRNGGKVHRKYEKAKTPYKRLMESNELLEEEKRKLTVLYLSLNPAQLRRDIEAKLQLLYQAYRQKNNLLKVESFKK